MLEVTQVHGRMIPVRRSNIDTDQIIPAYWMKRVERSGYQDGLFENWRKDPDFVLNDPNRAGASVLIAGENFGCGSSREHAVWALRDYGIQAVIAPSIADIHRGNLPLEGLVPVELEQRYVDILFEVSEEDPQADVEIDILGRTLTCASAGLFEKEFHIDDSSRFSLVNGLDLIDQTLLLGEEILSYESRRNSWLPILG